MSFLGRLNEHSFTDDPWADDDLKREPSGVLLRKLIHSLERSYVIAVKGDWGSGKTTFLRRLAADLEKHSTPVVFVDAWRSDYSDDPLVPFAIEIDARVEEKRRKRTDHSLPDLVPSLAESAVKLSIPLVTLAAAVAATPASAAAIGAATFVSKFGGMLLKRQKERAAALTTFHEGLSNARAFLTDQGRNRKPKQLVIIIDELDRCRPNYAISVLERIKHYFDVPNIVFLIATDGGNLPAAVQTVYGTGTEGHRYLRKFFDFEYELPAPNPKDFSNILLQQFEVLHYFKFTLDDAERIRDSATYEDSYLQELSQNFGAVNAVECIDALAEIARLSPSLSLRDQAQIFNSINCYLRTTPPDLCYSPQVLTFAEATRFLDSSMYPLVKRGSFGTLQNLAEKLGMPLVNAPMTTADIKVFNQVSGPGVDIKNNLSHIIRSGDRSQAPVLSAQRMRARLSITAGYVHPAKWLKDALWLTGSFQQTLGDVINEAELNGLTSEDLKNLNR
ncbi:KAP family P-loop NTPase fold protein [Lysobacter capsici]|uniref:KAP family P-loop NTPase fold protein n=1 Tax=Lysobacter capsici TaxID=435897 RepID=UPI0009E60883|nr:P-loop NTPase fold protein [Lysobacter capsici]